MNKQTRTNLTLAMMLGVLSLAITGCLTSKGYKEAVHGAYSTIADRMAGYELSPTEAADVEQLRIVSADKSTIRYETARPAWEAVAPGYRARVIADDTLKPQRRIDWMATADKLDRVQAAEQRYRQTLGIAPQP